MSRRKLIHSLGVIGLMIYVSLVPAWAQAGLTVPLDKWFPLPYPPADEISGAAETQLANRVLLVSDENRTALYDYDFLNKVVKAINFATPCNGQINDLEGLTRMRSADRQYFMMASLSLNSTCGLTPNRLRIGRFQLVYDAVRDVFTVQNCALRGDTLDSLRFDLIKLLPPGYVQDAATYNPPKRAGLDVECQAFVPAAYTPGFTKDALFLGLRGPLAKTSRPVPDPNLPNCLVSTSTGNAFYFYLLNPDEYVRGLAPAELVGPYELDLKGQGCRDATFITTQGNESGLLIVAGNIDDSPGDPHAYLFNTKDPFNPLSLKEIPIPPPITNRPIEGVAMMEIEGYTRLTYYDDRGPGIASEAVVTTIP